MVKIRQALGAMIGVGWGMVVTGASNYPSTLAFLLLDIGGLLVIFGVLCWLDTLKGGHISE